MVIERLTGLPVEVNCPEVNEVKTALARPFANLFQFLTGHLRQRLAGSISREFSAEDGRLHCLVLEPSAQQALAELLERSRADGFAVRSLSFVPGQSASACLSGLADSIIDYVRALPVLPEPLVVLVSPPIRAALAGVLAARSIRLPVLAHSEILDSVEIHLLGSFSLPERSTSKTALLTQQTLELFS